MKDIIVKEIIAFIKDEIINDQDVVITSDDNIIAKGFIDSLGMVKLITFMQEKYNINNSGDIIIDNFLTLDNFKTVDNIAELVLHYKKIKKERK